MLGLAIKKLFKAKEPLRTQQNNKKGSFTLPKDFIQKTPKRGNLIE